MNKLMKDIDRIGDVAVSVFHKLALFGIGAATVWAAGWTFVELFTKHHASVTDLLLMFIYLEIGAMVGIYFRTNHMPVRFLLYIAITALTRHMVDIMSHLPIKIDEMIAVAGSTFVIAVSVLIVRYTSSRFPSDRKEEEV
jgi:phosphate starvation-inducible membrane PsiE